MKMNYVYFHVFILYYVKIRLTSQRGPGILAIVFDLAPPPLVLYPPLLSLSTTGDTQED